MTKSGYCTHDPVEEGCESCAEEKVDPKSVSYNAIIGFVLRQERRKQRLSVKILPWSRYNTCRLEKGNYNVNMMHLRAYGTILKRMPSEFVLMAETLAAELERSHYVVREGYGPTNFDWSQICEVLAGDDEQD